MSQSVLPGRVSLGHLPTPLEPMDRLGAKLGMAPGALWVKRDDATGMAGGGNKVRKLEYLCAGALTEGCDVLVTGGGGQSNHARMTAAAANRLGLQSVLVLASERPTTPAGNMLLDELLGADIVWLGEANYYEIEAAIEAECRRLVLAGRRPYPLPVGGASTLGAVGYFAGALELAGQAGDLDLVIVADGSGGTHAGLAAGLGDLSKILGVDVGTRPDLDHQVPAMAAAVAALVGVPPPVGSCRIDHARTGAGYGAPTEAAREALDLCARMEGLILDPVYTGKAMAGLVAAQREGRIPADSKTVFLHTGGMPALFADGYAEWISSGTPAV